MALQKQSLSLVQKCIGSEKGWDCHQLETEGKKLIQSNQTFHDLGTIMGHPEFRRLYETYLQDPVDANVILCMLRAYTEIEKRLKEECQHEVTPIMILPILEKAMKSEIWRKKILFPFKRLS